MKTRHEGGLPPTVGTALPASGQDALRAPEPLLRHAQVLRSFDPNTVRTDHQFLETEVDTNDCLLGGWDLGDLFFRLALDGQPPLPALFRDVCPDHPAFRQSSGPEPNRTELRQDGLAAVLIDPECLVDDVKRVPRHPALLEAREPLATPESVLQRTVEIVTDAHQRVRRRFRQPRKFTLQSWQHLRHVIEEHERPVGLVPGLLHRQQMVPQPSARSGVPRQALRLRRRSVELQTISSGDLQIDKLFLLRSLNGSQDLRAESMCGNLG